ncbi:MAG TPA: tetratricopeptide repeat protein [Vicinamibacteria bacterium]|jgi:Tfp pilus assembly protein PilF
MTLNPGKPLGALLISALLGGAASAQNNPDAEARFAMGLSHLREGRLDMALEDFQKAAKLDPKNPYVMKGLGLAYAAKRKWGDAISAFRKALELNPYYVDVRNDLGTVLIQSGDREAGKKEFLTAFGDPTNPTPEISARNLGQAYLEEKNYPEAINWFRTSLGRNKSYPDAYLGLADGLLATGRQEEMVTQLEAGAKEAPGEPSLQLALGQAYFKVGRFTEARARLEEAVKKDPDGAVGRRAASVLKELPR